MLKPTRIMVPTDFSEYSDKALGQALDIAKQYKAKVFIVHAVPTITSYAIDYALDAQLVAAAEEESEQRCRDRFKQQLANFPQSDEVEVATDCVRGIPYEAILKEAEDREIDLVVIASLGQSGRAKYLIGSVARNVLKGAMCPVLLTK